MKIPYDSSIPQVIEKTHICPICFKEHYAPKTIIKGNSVFIYEYKCPYLKQEEDYVPPNS